MDNDDDGLNSDYANHPPKLQSSIRFWVCQIFYWLAYILVTCIFIPWALAMHVVIAVMAIPLSPLCCWSGGRKIFLFAYVLTVMVPGKCLWFNFLRSNQRRGKVWDFEMGKPQPVPLQSRRRLSLANDVKPQIPSQLLTKLPPEVRLEIYKHVMGGASSFISIIQEREGTAKVGPKNAKGPIKIRGYPYNVDSWNLSLSETRHRYPQTPPFLLISPRQKNGAIALLQTCRQVYTEAIDLLYSLPTINITSLHQPPFFHLSILPHRLAQIRTLHLVWDQNHMLRPRHTARSTARFYHRSGQCTFCNVNQWLTAIDKYMTGLRSIEIFIFLEKKDHMVSLGDEWVSKLFKLQFGPNGQREFKIHVFPKGEITDLTIDAACLLRARTLDLQLQAKIRADIELHRRLERMRELDRQKAAMVEKKQREVDETGVVLSGLGGNESLECADDSIVTGRDANG